MTISPPTSAEFEAMFRPARFRVDTYNELLAQLPRLDRDRFAALPAPHQAAIRSISEAHTAVTAEIHDADGGDVEQTQWYSHDDGLVECCLVAGAVITLMWPGDDTLVATRIAAAIGFDEANAIDWELPEGVDPARLALTTTDAAALRSGTLPPAVTMLGARHVVRLWSSIGGNPSGTDLAYDSTIVHTATGPWILDPGEEPSLRKLHPINVWNEIGMLLSGFDDEL